MSLRIRVMALFALVLLTSLSFGVALAALQAKAALREELAAGLAGARQTALSALEDLPRSDHPDRDLRQLVSTFDGNRHVLARLIGPDGSILAVSRPAEGPTAAPKWFKAIMADRAAPPEAVEVLGRKRIDLEARTEADVEAVWREFSGLVVILLGSGLAGLILVHALIGGALRPLRALVSAFVEIGEGDYGGRVDPEGPSELRRLQGGFNRMASQLEAMIERNRQLTHQLLTLQEEERLEIARDLHDDIGPHLFAANMDAEMIVRLCAGNADEALVGQARSIQSALSHVQREVRDLLVRLRPTPAVELGFGSALEELIRLWRARRPDVAFSLAVRAPETDIGASVGDVAYRVVQEGLSNAVRHGAPSWVSVEASLEAGLLLVRVADDGSGAAKPSAPSGFGLLGMGERVRGAGGGLKFGPAQEGGWRIEARLPLSSLEARSLARASL